jgi:uncharacterized phage infection (PIP) family protein YhgE
MATTQDIADLKAQFDERIGHLRESFGVVEGDVTRIGQFSQQFTFSSLEEHQRDNNDLNQVATDMHGKLDALEQALGEEQSSLKAQFDALEHLVTDGQSQLEAHIQQHQASHGMLHDATQTLAGNVEQVTGEADHARGEYVQHVADMHQAVQTLSEKLFATATNVDHSVKQTQTEVLDQASQDFHALIDSHLQGHLPSNFQETAQHLTQHIHDLSEHATAAGNNLQNEVATLLHDLAQYAQQEVHDKIEQKFQHLMQEALAFLMQEVMETIVVTTTGVATTTVMSEIIPVLAVLKHALDGIKEAIKVFKALEEIF